MGDYRYRWVRVRTPGANPVIAYQNVDRAIADGWEPVGAGDWPEGMPLALVEGRADHVLYRLPEEQALARRVPIDQFNAEAVAKIREQFLRDDPYKAKFAFYPCLLYTSLAAALSRDWITNRIMQIADGPEKARDRLRALELLGKHVGIDLFRETTRVERIERTAEDIDKELETQLRSIATTLEGKATDITPRQAPAKRRRLKPSNT